MATAENTAAPLPTSTLVRAHAGLFAAAAFYAGNFTIAKLVMPAYVQPYGFIVLRVVAAAALFWLTQWAMRTGERIQSGDWARLWLCALTGVAANQLLFFKGLSYTTPIHGALIMLMTPMLVLIAATVLLRERLSWQKITGVGIGLAGASLLVVGAGNNTIANAPNPVLGDLLVAANAISYSFYLILVKPLMHRYNPITVLKWVFTLGVVMVVPVGSADLLAVDWANMPTNTYIAIAYVLFCVTYLTYLFNTSALRVVSPSVVSAYIYLQPLLTAIIALFTRQDQADGLLLLSAALIFAGVYLSSKKNG